MGISVKTSLLCEYCACGPKLAGCEKGMVIDMGKHADSLKEESKFFLTDTDTGLTSEQVHERMESGLSNAVTGRASRATGRIIASNIFTYFNLIFFFLAAVLLYERSYNNLAFLGVVAANTVIGIVQELRSKKELEKLQLVNEPDALVIRDAKQKRILIEELVQDDIVLLAAGNQICADAVLCEGTLRVNEALVTGEADEVVKTSGDTLLSGSFVVSGQAKVRLTRVGDQSFSANISKSAKKIKKHQRPGMMTSLTRLIQMIGIIIIPFAALMFWNQHFVLGYSEKVSVENTAAAIIGMIPEGLYLLTSIALAASTVRLARKHTLVHDMKCIETLARVDTICVDKTGTITEPQMKLTGIIPVHGVPEEEVRQQLEDYVCVMPPDNETMKALQAYFHKALPNRRPMHIWEFSSRTKYSAADYGKEVYLLGAPEYLIQQKDDAFSSVIQEHYAHGERVLLFAGYEFEVDSPENMFVGDTLTGTVRPLALLTLTNPIRENASDTFQYFGNQGVAVKVISGDNALTAALTAQKAGIPAAEKYIDMSTVDGKKAVAKAAQEYTVFGRVTPEQKSELIRAMKKAGHIVAMAGDGVNDVLALKDADCAIAMASGSDAASNVADIVLLESDFSAMPQIVTEGRRVINNIQRSASLFLVKNIFSFFLCIISLISISLYPLKPAQISLASALMIGVPSFFLALEPNDEMVRGKFLRNVLFRAFPAALTAVALVEWSLLFADAFSISTEAASTIAFYLYTAAAYLMLYRVCRPMNVWHGILFGTMGVVYFAAIFLFPDWFHIVSLDYGCSLILFALLFLAFPIDRFFRFLFAKCEGAGIRLLREKS